MLTSSASSRCIALLRELRSHTHQYSYHDTKCNICKVILTQNVLCHRPPEEVAETGSRKIWSNISFDAIVPRVSGGDYSEPNTQPVSTLYLFATNMEFLDSPF